MANAGERALSAATQLEKIGFVDFTVDLVKGVYEFIVNASMDQLKAYADFVSKVAKTLEEYQAEVVGDDTSLQQNTGQYIKQVFGLEPKTNDTDTYELSIELLQSMSQHFEGVTITDGTGDKSFSDLVTDSASGEKEIAHGDLGKLVVAKLKNSAKESYDLIKTVLKIGMQKVVITNGEIQTKLTFHVDASDTFSKTTNNSAQSTSGWGIGGSISGQYGGGIVGKVVGSFIGGSLGGGYSSRKLNVSVVNEKSNSATNVNVDILGSVKIMFKTETFPSIDE